MRIEAESPFTGRQERRMKRRAEIAFIAALSKIADLDGLTEGDDEFDFFIEIPRGETSLHEFSMRLSDVAMAIRDRFGVRVSALPVGGVDLIEHKQY
jgi:hypothetical protein